MVCILQFPELLSHSVLRVDMAEEGAAVNPAQTLVMGVLGDSFIERARDIQTPFLLLSSGQKSWASDHVLL